MSSKIGQKNVQKKILFTHFSYQPPLLTGRLSEIFPQRLGAYSDCAVNRSFTVGIFKTWTKPLKKYLKK